MKESHYVNQIACPTKEQVRILSVLYAGLFTDLMRKMKLKLDYCMKQCNRETESWETMTLRMRVKDNNEIIATTYKDYILCVVQDCNPPKKIEKKEGEGGEKTEEAAKI